VSCTVEIADAFVEIAQPSVMLARSVLTAMDYACSVIMFVLSAWAFQPLEFADI